MLIKHAFLEEDPPMEPKQKSKVRDLKGIHFLCSGGEKVLRRLWTEVGVHKENSAICERSWSLSILRGAWAPKRGRCEIPHKKMKGSGFGRATAASVEE